MAYIGKQPLVGNFTLLDSITATTTDTYALTKDSVAVFPQTPANCIVSLNGVIQAPTDSYTISGSNIVFASALTGSDSIDFITVLGDVLNVGTVSDGTITTAKLASGVLPTNTPAFEAYTITAQTVAEETFVKLTFATEVFDSNSNYDNSSNYRFTPTTAGKYLCYTQATIDPNAFANERNSLLQFYKNGSALAELRSDIMTGASNSVDGSTATTHNMTKIIEFNGSSDYLEVFGKINTWNDNGADFTYKLFGAYKIIE
jgi:hypothetical protein